MNSIITNLICFLGSIFNFFRSYAGEILGAFLGFGFALVVEKMIENGNNKSSIKNVVIELKDIRDSLAKYKDNKDVPPCLAYSISLPIWETVKCNGNILEFRDKKYYNHVINVYAMLEQLISLENWLYDHLSALTDEKIQERLNVIIKLRGKIYDKLTQNIELIDLFKKKS